MKDNVVAEFGEKQDVKIELRSHLLPSFIYLFHSRHVGPWSLLPFEARKEEGEGGTKGKKRKGEKKRHNGISLRVPFFSLSSLLGQRAFLLKFFAF